MPSRCFISINVPSEFKKKISEFEQEFIKKIQFNWVVPENLHLTLKFLNEIESDQIAALKKTLNTIKIESFSLILEKLILFPSPASPRVLCIDLQGDLKQLQSLKKEIDKHCLVLGFPAENRGFSPHITLARIKKLGEVKKVYPYLNHDFALDFKVSSFVLMSSILTREGSQYEVLSEFPL